MRGYRSTSTQPPPYPNRYRAPARNAGCPTGRRREPTHSRAVFARESNRAIMHGCPRSGALDLQAPRTCRLRRCAARHPAPQLVLRASSARSPHRLRASAAWFPRGLRASVARACRTPRDPPSIPCPAPIEPPPVSALEGMTGARGPISHVNQIKLAGRFSA